MKARTAIAFAVGVVFGAALITPVMAVILPSWKPSGVTAVVLVDYDSLGGFKPRGDTSSLSPVWKQNEVTPVAMVAFQGASGKFVPLNSDSVTVPAWSVEAVRPWAEVSLNSYGDFEPKNPQ